MKRARLIYNPVAGKRMAAPKLDTIINHLQAHNWQVLPYRTTGAEDTESFGKLLQEPYLDAAIVAGGDGTLHHVVNALIGGNFDLPLGIIPVGTANDFAVHIGLPSDIEACCQVICQGNRMQVDVGWVNGTYFINTASAGLMAEIPYKTDVTLKNVLGKMAYYLKGIEELPNFSPIKVGFVSANGAYKQEVLLFIVMNGAAAGGFTNIAPKASIMDGLLDVIVVKPCHIGQLFSLLLKLIKGELVNDPRVEYFQTSELRVTCTPPVLTDLDGELGPEFPLEFKLLPGKLTVLTPKLNLDSSRRTMSRGELF
ncbi:MAG: YegS/Rv2252/BmrU family lipid kinase [Peptococcaceae bacterium]|nr:YegS/Rv2252/BmrU family lipid kinase [Peptococcaceae bacterium]